jgi:prepilin-type N-terminal cleavage/methylation domain-containing protein
LAKSRFSSSSSAGGFSLVEVIVAMAILATSLIAMAQLFAVATKNNVNARATTSTTILANQKLEQLRSLSWGFDVIGLPMSDFESDTTTLPPSANGGTGLSPSPGNTLSDNVPGYVDFIDRLGQPLGTGSAPPNNTAYVRRWSIEPLPTNPNNTLIIQVMVFETGNRPNSGDTTTQRLPNEARVATVKTRKAL